MPSTGPAPPAQTTSSAVPRASSRPRLSPQSASPHRKSPSRALPPRAGTTRPPSASTPPPRPASPSSFQVTRPGAIAGGIVGGIALLMLLALFWYLFRKNYPNKGTSPQFREPEYNSQYMQGYGRQISPKHIPIELTGYGHGGAGPSSGYPPANFRAQEREGFGLGSMMYVDGNGEHQPRKPMETVTEESAGGSSRVGSRRGWVGGGDADGGGRGWCWRRSACG